MERTRRRLAAACTALALACLTAAGCNDLLVERPTGVTPPDAYYRTGADLNNATVAVYSALRGLEDRGAWALLELASDQARADNREPNADTRAPDYLDWDADRGGTDAYWATLYQVITRANLVLAHAPNANAPDAQAKALNVAEARFLRGYAYLVLTKAYDAVPLLRTPEEQQNTRPARTPVDSVHRAAVEDLTAAEAALPVAWPESDAFGGPTQGRVTKGAAQMALADLYLWRSSFLGSNEWQRASDAARRVIDAGVWRLNADYFATFRPEARGNAEMIFVITNTGVDPRTSNSFQLLYYPRDWGTDQWGGWGLIHPTDWHLRSFEAGDYRREDGFLAGGCSGGGVCVDPFADGPMPRKWMVKRDGGADWTLGDFDVPLYRYAEALLIYAEAQNELGHAAEAVRYVNQVRARARNGAGGERRPAPADYAGPLDRASVRDLVYAERNRELQFEAKRWWDLVRRDGLEPGSWLRTLRRNDGADAERLRPLAAYKRRFPIPAAEVLANPALAQNPGY